MAGALVAWGNKWNYGIVDISYAYFFLSIPAFSFVMWLKFALGLSVDNSLLFPIIAWISAYFGGVIIWFVLGTIVGWIVGKIKSKK